MNKHYIYIADMRTGTGSSLMRDKSMRQLRINELYEMRRREATKIKRQVSATIMIISNKCHRHTYKHTHTQRQVGVTRHIFSAHFRFR
jgi:hypothetical protein